ncbi:Adenosine 3'-phospho 5'-phosphosulfate transporter 1 [Cryptotermes secundus]|uniref:Adenosine 3'-phospho 5'-phosphosulfate transporter 1 n=2 Tax=Cryptotermes secundus TaxID=105785 RepID=A0A2J7Q4U7_9NEOP|nr:adenosine 3'-phospho 5'-phosphosulfate transporter 1 [Cryptotermes secundus]XP_023717366.1 adenosine 3'-phospho 5'-phosphosulfate transporter 1 [Cryptotermes secundus]PNF23605.1 Adenosine 3'-phospho 5'-phosphosulfate transporter 1 [Cryptotermes secundus]PNF23607.1 Adenosine 3'-phospho 5'-phosphosulfate transporter 1 [Cryptotermes secundus]
MHVIMIHRTHEVIICLLFLGTVAVVYIITQILRSVVDLKGDTAILSSFEGSWLFRLCLNILGYATIFVPGFLIFKYVKKSSYLERTGPGCFPSAIRLCLSGPDPLISGDGLQQATPQLSHALQQTHSTMQEAILLIFCFLGLQLTYLTWGLLQEKIMTQEYIDSGGAKGHFTDSQFLVFVNRILAFVLSGLYIIFTRQPRHVAPFYKYVYCSFSNIMSSWCQYEALKYVSFPTQVLAKASKIIPVMIMGKIVSRKKYEYYEYVTAVLISVGMAFFMLGSADDHKGVAVTTFSGLILLASYMLFDSFTSNWQGELFSHYGMSSVQMMCGVNLFSCLFTAVSLAQQGGFIHSINFMTEFPKFVFDCLVLSVCSAAGQLFIYYTIATFGPVVFVIIMTIRQGLAILLSCFIYQHHITAVGIIGVIIVFVSVFLRIYCNQRLRAIRKRTQASSSIKV